MKRDYFVDFSKNIITVSRSFFEEAAKDTESAAHQKMLELRALGMNIKIAAKKRNKTGRLSYDKMQKFIDCLVDAKVYQDEFEAVRKVSKGQKNPYQYVLKWFENRFPNYDGLPEFDEKLRLVNTPADYDSEEDAA